MVHFFPTSLRVMLCLVLIVQLTGCGTLMYPERKGQKSGRIDSGVAILDGIGLLFFLVPGIIAFAIDFNNGTIYLPGTSASADTKDLKQVKFDAKHATQASIQQIIKDETGRHVALDHPGIRVSKLGSVDEIAIQMALALPDASEDRLVLLKK